MTDTNLIMAEDDTAPAVAQAPVDIMQGMQSQATGMIALDVESFSQGFMQIMLAGIGWASAEIASTEGADGEKELEFFTEKLSVDLPLIIQNIIAASNGKYQAPANPLPRAQRLKKKGMFSK